MVKDAAARTLPATMRTPTLSFASPLYLSSALLALVLLACGSSSQSASVPDGGGPADSAQSAIDAPGEGAAQDSDVASGDSAMPEGGAADAAPIVLNTPADTWTWVDVPGAHCGDGSATGIGVNPHAGATHLLIYLQGGGACFDAASCWGANATASNMTGYGAADFANDVTKQLLIFQRGAAVGNPFADADLVFVPYCTGDIHIGSLLASLTVNGAPKPTYFYGGRNVDVDLASLAISFKGLNHVWLSGVSAGGFGSFLNQDFVARAFPGVPVDMIDDSGPAVDLPAPVTVIPWGVRLPPACTGCTNLTEVFAFDRKTYPSSKYGLITYQTDTVLPSFFGVTEAQFATQIQTFVSSLASDPNAKAFVALSSGHVVLAEQDTTAVPFILPWLTKMANDDPTWANEQH